jgi:starch synthase (maltosyl-transferring)
VLAATLVPTWGVYAGFELYENAPVREGSEEYLHSEKYELKARDWAAAEAAGQSLAPLITALNRLRRRHPALQQLRQLRFHPVDNDSVLAYSKRCGDDVVLVVVNLDPHHTHEATVSLNMPELGLAWHESFPVRDELTGETYHWGRDNYVRLDPGRGPAPAHIFSLRPTPATGGSPT